MVSALAVAGRIGLTAIGDTLEEARKHYYDVKAALDSSSEPRDLALPHLVEDRL